MAHSDELGRERSPAVPAAARPPFPEQDEAGVDLSLLRAVLALPPVERLRLMERRARETRMLNEYGRRLRQAGPRPDR